MFTFFGRRPELEDTCSHAQPPQCCGKARTNFPDSGYNWGEKKRKWVLGVAMVTLRLDLLRKNRRLQ